MLSVIFNFVFDQPADPRAAVSLCGLTAVLCFFFGALCLYVCVFLMAIVSLLFICGAFI